MNLQGAAGGPEAQLLREVLATGVDVSDATTKDGVRRIASELSDVTLVTTSECGLVTAVHNGAGQLVDIEISDHALTTYDAHQLAAVLVAAVRRGESAVREVLRSEVLRSEVLRNAAGHGTGMAGP